MIENANARSMALWVPDSKTGAKVIQLNAPALAVLDAIERHDGNPHVIVGHKRGAHLARIFHEAGQ